MIGQVLLIAPDRDEARQLIRAFDVLGAGSQVVADEQEALGYLRSSSAELVVGEVRAIAGLRAHRPGLPVVVIVDRSDSGQIIDSIRRGALDCVTRPLRHEELVERLGEALRLAVESGRPSLDRRKPHKAAGVRMVGQSPAMQEVYRQIGLLAPRDINLLITGESGTGKELVAEAVVAHSTRADQPFVAINCAAIPETLLESELFGHEKGAFTGADRRRVGHFEHCDGGTLFLDEIGDMPPATQAKLLRVIESGRFHRVGGEQAINTDVRIIAATHQPLERMIQRKQFREDLYYRLKVGTIHLPPLRDREVDAVLLAHYFMDRIGRQMKSSIQAFDPGAVAALLAYPWPGNVRELENVIRSSLAIARGRVFRRDFLPKHVREPESTPPDPGHPAEHPPARRSLPSPQDPLSAWVQALCRESRQGDQGLMAEAVDRLERVLIHAVLHAEAGSITQAAKRLGISRTTLRKKMRDHQITVTSRPEVI